VIERGDAVERRFAHALRYAARLSTSRGPESRKRRDPGQLRGCGRESALHGDSGDVFDIRRTDKDPPVFGMGPHFGLGGRSPERGGVRAAPRWFERFPDVDTGRRRTSSAQPTFIMNGYQDRTHRLVH